MAEGPASALHAMLGKIRRDTDARRLNAIVNHPQVLPWVQGDREAPLDFTDAIEDRRHVLLMGEHGGILFRFMEPGLYEAHSQCLPEGRGEWMLAFTKAALHWMFCSTEAIEISTMVPKGNLAARALTKATGLSFILTRPDCWLLKGRRVPGDVYSLTIHDWIKTAPGLQERGLWFGRQIAADMERLGTPFFLAGGMDAVSAVGLAMEMFLGRQVQKSLVLFRRWALLADAEPMDLVSLHPLTVWIGNAMVVVRDSGVIYVASVRQD